MTQKNLKPKQTAPVQREINTTSSECGTGLTPNQTRQDFYRGVSNPFAGDDAE